MRMKPLRLRERPEVPDTIFDDIFRISGMTFDSPESWATPFWVDFVVALDCYGGADAPLSRPPRWSAATRAELCSLSKTLRRARQQIADLGIEARGFLGRRVDDPDRPLRYIVGREIETVAALESAARALETEIELLVSQFQPRRGDQLKATNEDRHGAFYEFAETVMRVIIECGGRATVDKNTGRGTLVTVLRLLKPYLPVEAVLPGFMGDDATTEGLHRLDDMRREIVRETKARCAVNRAAVASPRA